MKAIAVIIQPDKIRQIIPTMSLARNNQKNLFLGVFVTSKKSLFNSLLFFSGKFLINETAYQAIKTKLLQNKANNTVIQAIDTPIFKRLSFCVKTPVNNGIENNRTITQRNIFPFILLSLKKTGEQVSTTNNNQIVLSPPCPFWLAVVFTLALMPVIVRQCANGVF